MYITSVRRSALVVALSLVSSVDAQTTPRSLTLRWTSVAPGVWKATAGAPERVSLLGAAGANPSLDGLQRVGATEFPLDRAEIVAQVVDGKLALRFPLGAREQLYGLGLNFKAVEQRGSVKTLHVDHFGGTDNGRTHAPVPFYVSSAGYGVLIDAARYITVYAGTAIRTDSKHPPVVKDRNRDRSWSSQPLSDAVEVLVPAAGATIYVFGGPTPLDAVRRYNLFSGGGVLPPKWGLGFMHRVPTLFTADQATAEVADFASRGYPLDMLGLEPGWQSAAYPGTFVWDTTRFRDPDAFIKAMSRAGVRVNLWMNPYVAPTSPLFRPIAALSGSHTVWTGIVPDVMHPSARRIMLDHFDRELVRRGVSGYKIDEVDGYDRWLWPDQASFPSGLSGEQMRQVYGVAIQRATADVYRARDQRTYGLVRASNAGAASLPYVIYNDYYGHPEFLTALVSSSFIGVLWTPEVRSSKTGEEWLRRMQAVCFSPLAMLNAWSDGTKPWSFAEVATPVRDVMQLRIRLLPYIYTAFARYHFDGIPPVRAMALEKGFRVDQPSAPGVLSSTDNPYAVATRRDVKDQWMLGDALLVAPMFAGDSTRTVVLPSGRWYDFWTGALAGDGQVITVKPGLDRIPLFVREGSTIPMLAGDHLHVPAPGEPSDLELRHYGREPGTFELYDDDGITFGYERGAYSWTPLTVARGADGALVGAEPRRPAGKPFSYRSLTWRMMTPR
ncbi:MAG TPA: TIM-barrel domain-containing protein [Gemmatimonadaceae bacterium]|nr:TIM-barrel domain-containing protein [Gemmatimonadaceae bacterium]